MTIQWIVTFLFGSGVLTVLCGWVVARIREQESKTEAVCKGVQALLRDRLYQSYNHYTEKGYAPIYAKENFQNMYRQYHVLGMNGVMDSYMEKFLLLPDEKE